MTDKVKEQIIAVSETGETNMFLRNTVQIIAFKMGYFELVDYLLDDTNKTEYFNFILTGEA